MLTLCNCEEIQEMKGPSYRKAGGFKTSVSVPVHLWSFRVGQFCQHVVAACHHSSASLGTTVLSSLHTRWADVSCLFSESCVAATEQIRKSDEFGHLQCVILQNAPQPAGARETMLMLCSSSSIEAQIQLGRKQTTKKQIQ